MLRNYLTLAVRHLGRQRVYAFINVFGLAVGVAGCLLILLYVREELRYDRFHEKADRLFRVVNEVRLGEVSQHWALSALPLAAALQAEVPEVETAVRFARWGSPALVRHGERRFYEDQFHAVDPAFLSLFDFPLRLGDARTALAEPYTAVLTEAMAEKYFGRRDPVGEVLTVTVDDSAYAVRVTGVLAPVPTATHLHFDFLTSFQTLQAAAGPTDNWLSLGYPTYVLLRTAADEAAVNRKLPAFLRRHTGDDIWYTPYVQPVVDIRLNLRGLGIGGESDVRYVYLFTTVALLILGIACINYVNLATARAASRAREVGVRKVLGAGQARLVRQFMVEAALLGLLALVFGVMLAELALPLFNRLLEQDIRLDLSGDPALWVGLAALAAGTTLFAGGYPALVLSRFPPAAILRGRHGTGGSGRRLRQALVVVQFAASLVLLAGTLVVYRQLGYVQQARLGFDRAHVVVLPLRSDRLARQYETLKEALRQHPGVVSAAASSTVPGGGRPATNGIRIEGGGEGFASVLAVDHDFLETYGLALVEGRWFSEAFPGDAPSGFVLNREAARHFGLATPLGRTLSRNEQTGRVIGVVEDFHFASLHHRIGPLVLYMAPEANARFFPYRNLSVRIRPEGVAGTLDALAATWASFAPEHPFTYTFLDEGVGRLYRNEQRLGVLFGAFTGLAVLVACLGLFGLIAFTTEQRTKEIGIRKALGASAAGIVVLLSKDFLLLIAVAFAAATPVAYVLLGRWLDGFAYRIALTWDVFALAGLALLALALLTMGYRAFRAAGANPATALRYE